MIALILAAIITITPTPTPGDTTNDTEALQQLINQGGTITLDPGVYWITPDQITITQDVTIIGDYSKTILRVINQAGPYTSMFTGNANITLKNLVFDMNQRNQTGTPNIHTPDRRMTLQLSGTLTIDGCAFRDSNSINVIVAHNATITDTAFVQIGGPTRHDHSTIYLTDNSLIENNRFVGTGYARTAIETHGTNMTVRNNTIVGYEKGMNITGAGSAPDGHGNQTIENNRIQGATYGIVLWSLGPGPFHDVTIRNNTLQIDKNRWLPAVGEITDAWIWTYPPTQPTTRLAILNNSIYYIDHVPVEPIALVWAIDPTITGNRIEIR